MAPVLNIIHFLMSTWIHAALSQSSICIWGRTGMNSLINGLYTQTGYHSGQPYYTNTVCSSQGSSPSSFVLWWDTVSTKWGISGSLGNNAFYGYCTDPSLSNCNAWYVYDGTMLSLDPSTYVTADSCPSWQCDKVQIPSLSNSGCDAVFDVYVGDNAWTNSENTLFWYFSPCCYKWLCADSFDPTCTASYYANTDPGWVDLSNGESTALSFAYPIGQHTVNCITNTPIDVSSASPTIPPTISPTTLPTNPPTAVPTILPTNVPSEPQTNVPSESPTNVPSVSPTHVPTVSPTMLPTISPTNDPTISPTIMISPSDVPTIAPSMMPTPETQFSSPTVSPSNGPTETITLFSGVGTMRKVNIIINAFILAVLVCVMR